MADKGMTANQVMQAVVEALQAKKAKEVKVLETGELTILADYFVICTATSTTHIKTLSDEVQKQLEEKDDTPRGGVPVRRLGAHRSRLRDSAYFPGRAAGVLQSRAPLGRRERDSCRRKITEEEVDRFEVRV